jgi:hypothetical protein
MNASLSPKRASRGRRITPSTLKKEVKALIDEPLSDMFFDSPSDAKTPRTSPKTLNIAVESFLSGELAEAKPENNKLSERLDNILEKVEDEQRFNGYSGIKKVEDTVTREVIERLAQNQAVYGPAISKDGILSQFKSLQGRILTIVDGCFSDPVQRGAIKTLVSKEFRREMSKVEAVALK